MGVGRFLLATEGLDLTTALPLFTTFLALQSFNSAAVQLSLYCFKSAYSLIRGRYPSWFPLFACVGIDPCPLEEELYVASLILFLVKDFFDFPETFF